MKPTSLIITALILAFAGTSLRADVTLGDATFNATSADVAATWYDPMTVGTTKTFEGSGTNEGKTRTISFSAGGEVAGVTTLKRRVAEDEGAAAAEDTWIAFDGEDNARVLKIERAGAVVFEATAEATPPLYLPADPQDAQSWVVAGTTVTIEWVARSASGYKMKINYVEASGTRHTDTIDAGKGLVQTVSGDESGWKLKPGAASPVPAPESP